MPKYKARGVINERNLVDFNGCIQNVLYDDERLEESEDKAHFRVEPCYTNTMPGKLLLIIFKKKTHKADF